MSLQLARLGVAHPELNDDGASLQRRIEQLHRVAAPRLRRLWDYYRNAATPACDNSTSGRPYRQAQEWGLPPRITGRSSDLNIARKEVVIENDIAWRVDAMVDFLFGQPIVVTSLVKDEARRAEIDSILRKVFAFNGGVAFLQKLALLGAVYGYVDVLVKYVPCEGELHEATPCGMQQLGELFQELPGACDDAALARAARTIRFEIVEPTRSIPIFDEIDSTTPVAYAQHWLSARPATAPRTIAWMDALKQVLLRTHATPAVDASHRSTLEVVGPTRWQRYEDGRLIDEGENSLGRLPLVHVQNAAVPFEYAGASDVEPLLPLQDELNTRLSDRAHRITMQSFKMYLGKGIDDFMEMPVAPGRMYSTDNENAQIIEFGGDAACPSEQAHIDEIREALDKTSGVSPIAAGAIKGRIGRLSSAAALRVTLLALLGRTERKRTTYGPAIAQLCELSLSWLDRAGLFRTTPAERRVSIYWPNPIPANEQEQLDTAKAKQSLGIDPAQVARELGY